eukprot:Sspe_Gene.50177::Locus_27713_Transcript_3_3_Confidence_0.600_Length_2071::g.50177::m.50177
MQASVFEWKTATEALQNEKKPKTKSIGQVRRPLLRVPETRMERRALPVMMSRDKLCPQVSPRLHTCGNPIAMVGALLWSFPHAVSTLRGGGADRLLYASRCTWVRFRFFHLADEPTASSSAVPSLTTSGYCIWKVCGGWCWCTGHGSTGTMALHGSPFLGFFRFPPSSFGRGSGGSSRVSSTVFDMLRTGRDGCEVVRGLGGWGTASWKWVCGADSEERCLLPADPVAGGRRDERRISIKVSDFTRRAEVGGSCNGATRSDVSSCPLPDMVEVSMLGTRFCRVIFARQSCVAAEMVDGAPLRQPHCLATAFSRFDSVGGWGKRGGSSGI